MKVHELVALLQDQPQDATVLMWHGDIPKDSAADVLEIEFSTYDGEEFVNLMPEYIKQT